MQQGQGRKQDKKKQGNKRSNEGHKKPVCGEIHQCYVRWDNYQPHLVTKELLPHWQLSGTAYKLFQGFTASQHKMTLIYLPRVDRAVDRYQ